MGWTVMAGIGLGLLAQQGVVIRARQQVGMSLLVLALITVWQTLAAAEGWPLLPVGDAFSAAFGHPFVFAVLAAAAAFVALPALVSATENVRGSAGGSGHVAVVLPVLCGLVLALPQVIELATSQVSSLASKALTSIEFAQGGFVVLLLWWSLRAVVALAGQRQRFVEFVPPVCTLAAGGLGAFVISDAWSTDSSLGHGMTLAGVAVVLAAVVRDGAVRRPIQDVVS
jgi:asparagine N-glycosylation enzyme membrane subunit Stt3